MIGAHPGAQAHAPIACRFRRNLNDVAPLQYTDVALSPERRVRA